MTYCTWWYTITNYYWDARPVSVIHNDTRPNMPGSTMFTYQWGPNLVYGWNWTLDPGASVSVCINLVQPAAGLLVSEKIQLDFLCLYRNTYLLRSEPVTVYVIPEPIIADLEQGSVRLGNFLACRLIQNKNNPFSGQMVVGGDLDVALFRTVQWTSNVDVTIIQGDERQRLMTIRSVWWEYYTELLIDANITFALPTDTNDTIVKFRRCQLTINQGPDGTYGTYMIVKPGTGVNGTLPERALTLTPFETYRVDIAGWSDWTTIYYSVWFYYSLDATKMFRLSADSNSTTHYITIPSATPGADLVILIQATDFLAYPMVPCGSCAQAQNVTNLTNAEVLAAITPLVEAPITTYLELLQILSYTAKLEGFSGNLSAKFLENVKQFVANNDAGTFCDLTSTSWYAQLGLRGDVEDYDVEVAAMLNDIVQTTNNLTSRCIIGVVYTYGTVLRREATPLIYASNEVWRILLDMAPNPTPIPYSGNFSNWNASAYPNFNISEYVNLTELLLNNSITDSLESLNITFVSMDANSITFEVYNNQTLTIYFNTSNITSAYSNSPGGAIVASNPSKFSTMSASDLQFPLHAEDDFQKFAPQQAMPLAAPAIRDYIYTTMKTRATVASFREVDCMQSDPSPDRKSVV